MEQQTGEPRKASALELSRLKAASEDYKVHKSIYLDSVTGEPTEGFLEWPAFRDQFLTDWKSNRRIVTEQEADVHFDRIADESLSELDSLGATADVSALAEQVVQTQEAQDDTIGVIIENPTTGEPVAVATAPVVAPKRRGRPPGKAKLKVVVSNDTPAPAAAKAKKSYYIPVSQRKVAAKKAPKKAAAKKKGSSGKSTSERAAVIVAWGQSRKWSRKDIIDRMTSQIDGLGAAYASTLYQKLAK